MSLSKKEKLAKDFSTRVKAARVNAGLSQSELGKVAKMPVQQISHYENGVNLPTPHRLKDLCLALDVTADYLLALD